MEQVYYYTAKDYGKDVAGITTGKSISSVIIAISQALARPSRIRVELVPDMAVAPDGAIITTMPRRAKKKGGKRNGSKGIHRKQHAGAISRNPQSER